MTILLNCVTVGREKSREIRKEKIGVFWEQLPRRW